MIISIDKLRKHVVTDETNESLRMRMEGIEDLIRKYTNHHFLDSNVRASVKITENGETSADRDLFIEGDTVEIFHSEFSDGLHEVVSKEGDGRYILSGCRMADEGFMVRVSYPASVVMGAISMLKYDLDKAGREDVASETLSRHSVTYRDEGSDGNAILGYPSRLTSFLRPFRRVRF